jgi:hypothetical protein
VLGLPRIVPLDRDDFVARDIAPTTWKTYAVLMIPPADELMLGHLRICPAYAYNCTADIQYTFNLPKTIVRSRLDITAQHLVVRKHLEKSCLLR